MAVKFDDPKDYISRINSFRSSVFRKAEDGESRRVWHESSLNDVKRLVLICGASRSGSSLLFAVLKKLPQIYSLSGEEVPFYKLNAGSSGGNLSRDFLSDFSLPVSAAEIKNNTGLLKQYIDNLVLRFPLQWPQVDFSFSFLRTAISSVLGGCLKRRKNFDKEDFYLELLARLMRKYPQINPYYYDISAGKVRRKFPALKVPSGPPNDTVMIEEPPFILLSPARGIKKSDLEEKTLLLKASVNCYRINFIRKVFPNARLRIIYLTRNPLSSVNGLYDGWLHRGFFSEKLTGLKIKGYSDVFSWGSRWWKYDLPSGWRSYADKSLQEVCAFQWYSANKAVLGYLRQNKAESCEVKYEEMAFDFNSRAATVKKIMRFIGIRDYDIPGPALKNFPLIQATQKPAPYRWKARKEILLPLLEQPHISDMGFALGYGRQQDEKWL